VLGVVYRGCDLLGQVAESVNAGIDSESTADRHNTAEVLQAGMSSLRRSLSLVTLSDLVPSMVAPDCSAADSQVDSCATDVDHSLPPISCSRTEEQHSLDNDSRQRYSFEAAESSFADIPPLSQRLHLQPQSDSTLHREPATRELPSSAVTSQCDKVRRNQSSQRTANSDSMALPSKRRLALMMRVAHVLSDDDDVFLDCLKSSPDCDCKATSLQPTEADQVISEDNIGYSTDTSPFHKLDARVAENAVESDVIQKFNTALHIVDKDERSKPVSRDSLSERCEATKRSGELDNTDHSAVNNAVLSSFDESSSVTAQHNEQLMWSPRHCGNFCLETSIMNTPSLDVNGNDDSALQIDEFPVCSNENRVSFDRETTGSDGEKTDMSCLLFDEPVTSEDKSILPSYGHNNSSVTETGASYCNDSDHSVIVID